MEDINMVSKTKQPRKRTLTTDPVRFVVNGINVEFEIGDKPHQIEPSHTLSHTLRETLGLTGTKISCDDGACGACTVIMDGKAVLSCKILTVECDGKTVTTIEGLRTGKQGHSILSSRHLSTTRPFSAASAHRV